MFLIIIIFLILVFVVGCVLGPSPTSGGNTLNNHNQAMALVDKATSFAKSNNMSDAFRCLYEAISLDPTNVHAIFFLGIFYVRIGDIDQSKEMLERLKKMDSSAAETLEEDIIEYMQNNYKSNINNDVDENHQNNLSRYYDILEVEIGASRDKVRQAYKEMVKVWHPDRFEHDQNLKNKAQTKMKMINEAYQRLIAT